MKKMPIADKLTANNIAEVEAIYEKMGSEKEPYSVNVLNRPFTVLPGVFSPKYLTDSQYFSERIPEIVKKKKILEIGTGTGIIAIFCALNGAEVVATDINPIAVKNARTNADLNHVNVDVREGDLFEPVKVDEKFDFIFWNHPWIPLPPPKKDNLLMLAGFDADHKSVKKYIREAKNYLRPNGKVLLGTGGFANIEDLERYAREHGYTIKIICRDPMQIGPNSDIFIYYQIYELSIRVNQ